MAYGLRYKFAFESQSGVDYEIQILQDGYSGSVTQRALGRAPVLRRDLNDCISGSSLEIAAECLVDGEFAALYTSDAFEYKAVLYRSGSVIWTGFVSPELYSEPDIAPPYDVSITATDGLGELRNVTFGGGGLKTLRAHLTALLAGTGLTRAIYLASGLTVTAPTAVAANALLDGVSVDLDHMVGESSYDVLQALLASLHARIVQSRDKWLVYRDTDLEDDDGVTVYNSAGTALKYEVASFGSMRTHDWWPVGSMSSQVVPACKELSVMSEHDYVQVIPNGEIASDSDWTKVNATYIDDGYYRLTAGAVGQIYQTVVLTTATDESVSGTVTQTRVPLSPQGKLGLRILASAYGSGETEAQLYVSVQATFTNGTTAYLTRAGSGFFWSGTAGAWMDPFPIGLPQQTYGEDVGTEVAIDIPIYTEGRTNGTVASLQITVGNGNTADSYARAIYAVVAETTPQSKGTLCKVVIDNDAREEASETEVVLSPMVANSRESLYRLRYGLPIVSGGPATTFATGKLEASDYLSVIARDYGLSCALPRLRTTGVLQVPASTPGIPVALKDSRGLLYFPDTVSWDLLLDEMTVDMTSLPAAQITVESDVMTSVYDTASGSAFSPDYSGGGSGGGSSAGALEALESQVTALQQDFETLEETVGVLDGTVGTLDGRITTNANSINSLSTTLDGVSLSVDELSENYTDLEAIVAEIPSTYATKAALQAETTAREAIGTEVTALQQGFETLEETVGVLDGTVGTLDRRITTNANRISTLSTTLDGVSLSVDELTENYTALEAIVAEIPSTYATKAALQAETTARETWQTGVSRRLGDVETAVEGLDDRLGEAEAEIGTNTAAIASHATTIASHTTSIGTLTTDVSTLKTNVSDLEDLFDSDGKALKAVNADQLGGHAASYFATASALGTLRTSVSTLQQGFETLEETVGVLDGTVGTLDGRITANANSISTLSTTLDGVSLSVDELTENYTALSGVVSTKLDKSIWDSIFEIKTTSRGVKYVSVKGGLAANWLSYTEIDGSSSGGGQSYAQRNWAYIQGMTADVSGDLASAYAVKQAYDQLAAMSTNVSFSQTQTSGTLIGVITIDDVAKNIYAPTIPTSLKNPYALTFGSKTYDGSAARTILASDLGALTAHQSIYTLTFAAGAFSAGSFVANSAAKTIKVPTHTSHLTNNSGYITADDIPTSIAWGNVTGKPAFAAVATSGSYNDLSNKPTIPTNTNQLTNGAGYITSAALAGYATESWVGSNYLPLTGGTIKNGSSSNPFNIDTNNTTALYMSLQCKGVEKACFIWSTAFGVYLRDSAANRLGLSPDGTPHYYNGTTRTLLHSGNIGDYNAGSATKLQTARTIWGQSFDGTDAVSGALSDVTNINSAIYINSSGNVTIGSADRAGANYKLYIEGGLGMLNGETNAGVLGFSENKLYLGYSNVNFYDTIVTGKSVTLRAANGTDKLILNSSGNVLIGTSTDNGSGAKLQVNKLIYVQADQFNNTGVQWGLSQTSSESWLLSARGEETGKHFRAYYYNGSEYVSVLDLVPNGNVLIGTSTDNGSGARLQVEGGLYVQNTDGGIVIEDSDGNSFATTSGYIKFNNTYATVASIELATNILTLKANAGVNIPNGNVGIGTSSPAYKLDVAGTLRATGAATFSSTLDAAGVIHSSTGIWSEGWLSYTDLSSTSDARFKKDIKAISSRDALRIIKALKPCSWTWNELSKTQGRGLGFIAQEMQGILPEAIREIGYDKHLAINYQMLHALEVASIQKHDDEITRLRRRVETLEKELDQLRRTS